MLSPSDSTIDNLSADSNQHFAGRSLRTV